MSLQYFELQKLPKNVGAGDKLELWLSLFAAKTEEDLVKIESLGVTEMEQAIGAYRSAVVTPAFKEWERLRSLARHNEASALEHARKMAIAETEAKWESVVADVIADKDAEIARLLAQLSKDV